MKDLRPFEIGLIGFFAVAAIGAVILISVFQSAGSPADRKFGDRLNVWGSLDADVMNEMLNELSTNDKAFDVVRYREIDERYFEDIIVDAMAEGAGPDVILLPHSHLVSMRSKLNAIPYESYPESTYAENFLDGASIFAMSDGIYGLPFAVDPLMMYWNKDLFSSAGFATEPKTWEELVSTYIGPLRNVDSRRNILQAALSFGEYGNVEHAKEILAMLMLQTGSDIVAEARVGYTVTMNKRSDSGQTSALSALTFYTQFALPSESVYTWNRSMERDQDAFLAGDLAIYFAPGSEYPEISDKNPNLFFGMATVPQGAGATVKRTEGEFYAFAFPKNSPNFLNAYNFVSYITAPAVAGPLADAYHLAPAHRSLHTTQQTDTFKKPVYQSALISRGWLDPNPDESDAVFKDMVEEVTSGNAKKTQVISNAVTALENSF